MITLILPVKNLRFYSIQWNLPKSTELVSVGAKTGLADAGCQWGSQQVRKSVISLKEYLPLSTHSAWGERLVKQRETEWASFLAPGHGVKLICSSSKPIWGCWGTFSFKGSKMLFFSFVCCFSRILYSLSVPGKQERAEWHAVLRTEIMREGTCLDSFQWLPSGTFYLNVIYSVMPLLLKILNAFLALWRLLFAWLCFCSIFFLLLKAALCEDI